MSTTVPGTSRQFGHQPVLSGVAAGRHVYHLFRRQSLARRLAIVGFVVWLSCASALAWFIDCQIYETLLAHGAERAADHVRLGVASSFQPDDLAPPFSEPRRRNLTDRLSASLGPVTRDNSDVLATFLFARDGTTLYSNRPNAIGRIKPTNSRLFDRAINGAPGVKLTPLEERDNADLKAAHGEALEVYTPITIGGQVVGVYELYLDTSTLNASRLWARLGIGAVLAGLFVLAGSVVWSIAAQLRSHETEIEQRTFFDDLTKLPNRSLYLDRLQQAVTRASRENLAVGVAAIDLDNFKVINESLGRGAGDQLLIAVAHRIRQHLRDGDTVARLGGDKFGVIIENSRDIVHAANIVHRIINAFDDPFRIGGRETYVAASAGLTLSTPDRDRPADLLRDADLALYRARHGGQRRIELFDRDMNAQANARLQLETDLRLAVERREFRVVYQPIINLATGAVIELEALARWDHPTRGPIAPGEFIPAAEENGLILPIGRFVLRTACAHLRSWRDTFPGAPAPVIAVNLSARQFHHPSLLHDVTQALDAAQIAPECLKLEITESAMMQGAEQTQRVLRELKALGVSLSIDDFGVGYSSLSYLKRFPIDLLKIDRSFVKGLAEDSEDLAIVQSIISIAKALRLKVTGEGIETDKQRDILHGLGCDHGQGYLFAEPLMPDQIAALFARTIALDSPTWQELGAATRAASGKMRRALVRAELLATPPRR